MGAIQKGRSHFRWKELAGRTLAGTASLGIVFLLGGCGGSDAIDTVDDAGGIETDLDVAADKQADDSVMTDEGVKGLGVPTGEVGWLVEVSNLASALWSEDSQLVDRIDLLVGTDAVDRLGRQFEAEAEIVSGIGNEFPGNSPVELETPYASFLAALDEWSTAANEALEQVDERGGDLQNELNLMGDDIGQIMEASEASSLQRAVFEARERAIDACFDLQAANQAVEPLIVCSDATPVAELVGDRIKVETLPPFTMGVADPSSVLPFPNGVNIDGNGTFVISSDVIFADPEAAYSEMSIEAIEPPADLQKWIDDTAVISVVDQGSTSVDDIESRWWQITGDEQGLEAAGSSFVGLYQDSGRDIPQQIAAGDSITIWEIPHPESTIYVFAKIATDMFRGEVFDALDSIAFDV